MHTVSGVPVAHVQKTITIAQDNNKQQIQHQLQTYKQQAQASKVGNVDANPFSDMVAKISKNRIGSTSID